MSTFIFKTNSYTYFFQLIKFVKIHAKIFIFCDVPRVIGIFNSLRKKKVDNRSKFLKILPRLKQLVH